MFEVFIENFCKEKQAAWLEGCVEVYMAQYAKKAENDYPKEAVMRIAKATFEKGIDIQDVIEFSELPEELLSALRRLMKNTSNCAYKPHSKSF